MSQPTEPFETQNVRDDDGAIIDSFFIETDSPPDLKELNEPILVRALEQPRKITRLFSGDMTLGVDWGPQQLFPADANRKSLTIYVYSESETLTDGVRISDDPGMVKTAGKVLHNGTIDLGAHTGPIWIVPYGQAPGSVPAQAISIQYWSTTE